MITAPLSPTTTIPQHFLLISLFLPFSFDLLLETRKKHIMSSHKRPHTPLDGDSSPRDSPTPKAARIVHSPSRPTNSSDSSLSEAPLYCTLPPTCNPPTHKPTPLANTKELESHYAKHHAHVCEVRGCGCVFPDARLLELVSVLLLLHISRVLERFRWAQGMESYPANMARFYLSRI